MAAKKKPELSKYWKDLQKKLRARNGVTYNYGRCASPGAFTIKVFHEDMPMPLCVVWFNFFGNKGIQILNSFVFEYARRCGLRTYAHEMMLTGYPGRFILSGAGTESGTAWMKAAGYRKTEAGWEFRPKKAKATEARV